MTTSTSTTRRSKPTAAAFRESMPVASAAPPHASSTSAFYFVATPAQQRKARVASPRPRAYHMISASDVTDCYLSSPKESVWLVASASALRTLIKHAPKPRGDQRLVVLEEVTQTSQAVLGVFFRQVAVAAETIRLLPMDELVEVLSSESRADLFIGGAVEPDGKVVLLYRGNIEPMVVPFSWFRNRHSQALPNIARFEVRDFGQTVALGEFEAAADAILYEFDDGYRRRAKARLVTEDSSLGGAIRRLRLQKALKRSDFPGIHEKEIARIERNEVKKPHAQTLSIVAKTLGVAVHALGSY